MLFDNFLVVKGDGMEEFDVLGLKTIIDLEKAESVSISTVSTLKMGGVFKGGKCALRDVRRCDPIGFKLLKLEESERIALPKGFFWKGIGGIHLNARLEKNLVKGIEFRSHLKAALTAFANLLQKI